MLINNRYQIIRKLGEGGFGETFLAEDIQMPSKRLCVVKQLKPITTNPQIYKLVEERFQREAVILEKLGEKSQQIPSLYAYLSEDGQFYLIQEWIEGSTLENLISNQNTLSEKDVREILVNLLPVLEFVHVQGMIHRDIKPENIILRQTDHLPVLIDFGAVREIMGTVFNSRGNPTSSIVIGTPGYMPPEQAAGRPIASSDLYSLGLTAIYLLTGKMPQDLATDSQSGEILWLDHAQHVSAELVEVLSKAIRSHPRDRYGSASQMLSALEETPKSASIPPAKNKQPVSNLGTEVISPSHPTQVSNSPNQKRSPFVVGGVIVSGLIGAAVLISFLLPRMMPQPTVPAANTLPDASKLSAQKSSSPVPTPDGSIQPEPSPPATTLPSNSSPTAQSLSEAVILNAAPGSQINVYAQPTTRSTSPHYGLAGDQATALKRVQGDDGYVWYFVRFPSGADGWVRSDFVRLSTSPVEVTTTAATLPSSAQLTGNSPGSRVNIRSSPSTRSNSPHYGLVGDRVTVLKQSQGDDGNTWYFVQFPSGATGWVRSDFIELR